MKIKGYDVLKSTRKNKKYDVFKNEKYILSFGALGMKHFKDKIGLYKNLDHNDEQRKLNFKSRFRKLFEKNKNNPESAIYWSWKYLW